jgi:hypothetical protein
MSEKPMNLHGFCVRASAGRILGNDGGDFAAATVARNFPGVE